MNNNVRVEIVRCTNAAGRPVEIGEVVEVTKGEGALLVTTGCARYATDDTGGGGGADEADEADEDGQPDSAPRRRGRPRVS